MNSKENSIRYTCASSVITTQTPKRNKTSTICILFDEKCTWIFKMFVERLKVIILVKIVETSLNILGLYI